MYKKALCVLIILSFIKTSISQDSIRIMLEFTMVHVVDTTQPANPRITPCMLLAGSGMSVYDDYYRTMHYLGYRGAAVDRIYNTRSEIEDVAAGITCDQIYTNFEKQELITGSYFSNTLYAKAEPLPTIEWTIQSQTKKILSLECQMATATFRSRHYTAWFAPAIPINAGPWKLHGLPGIILAANDDKNEVYFTCTKITMPEKNAPLITLSKNAIRVSAGKFDKTKKTFERDPMAGKGMSADPRGTMVAVTASPAVMAEMQTKTKRRLLNNPIEKD